SRGSHRHRERERGWPLARCAPAWTRCPEDCLFTGSAYGSRTAIVTRVGADAATLPTWQAMLNEGLDVSACEHRKDMPTALTVSAAFRADRMMLTHDPINENLEDLLHKEAVSRKLHSARHVHFACALRRPQRWIPVMKSLREMGITVSANFGWNPDLSVQQLLSIVKYCEFIFPNEHEAKAITGTRSATQALEKLVTWARVPVVKLDGGGAMLHAEGRTYRRAAPPLPVVDATGASDAFDGGFLHAFLRGAEWEECLRVGNICSSLSATQPGGPGGLPSEREMRHWMDEGTNRKPRSLGRSTSKRKK
ncbi:MAG: PfkB family carbohydrate kinase, partial [Terriglobus sp.]